MQRGYGFAVAFCLAMAPGAWARPVENDRLPRPLAYTPGTGITAGAPVGAAAAQAFGDTVCYGGTVADGLPDPIPGAVPALRPFRAARNGRWSFDSGIGSNFTEATPTPKPAGYHHRMEGWTGSDFTFNPRPWFRRSTLCALNGGFSMYAGLSAAEAGALCYASGQGYGNNWNLTLARTFAYPGTGNITLSYRYRVENEPDFDYLFVNIDTTGTGAAEDLNLASYTGTIAASTATHALVRGTTLRSTPGPITIKFNVTSDGGYSDEDGSYPTVCGHSAVDNVTLNGAVTDFSDFESGTNGWAQLLPVSGPGGEWADIRAVATLPPPLTFCPCALSDSVLVFADLTGGHQTAVFEAAWSPWIDLRAGGDVGRPGKIIRFNGYFNLPLSDNIMVTTQAQWYPALCPATGQYYVHPPADDGFVRFFGSVPNCTSAGSPISIDFSAVIPPSAEQVKIAVGVLSYCNMFANCSGVSNTTPWFDDITLCVYGAAAAPIVTLQTVDLLQDNFCADGSLNPGATGRVDVNVIKGSTLAVPGTALGDTLVVRGDGGNQEVRVVFHVRPGPGTSAAGLAAWAAAKWTPEPGLGSGWYSARCDTAEVGGKVQWTDRRWMSALHESDPHFGGGVDTDRGAEGDANQLSHDIFPDHLLTPGARIDYFVKARYLPPDPRNPGGTSWSLVPDTTGGRFAEMEILPSSMALDSTWNCVLYVNHHAGRDEPDRRLEELGLTGWLGAPGLNAEATRFDRYDVDGAASGQASLARPTGTRYGATPWQLGAYRVVAWHAAGAIFSTLYPEDAGLLTAWLQEAGQPGRRLWLSGDGLVARANVANSAQKTFLQNLCGVQFTCDTIRLAGCPAGAVLDSTYCLPLAAVAGAAFNSAPPVSARGNGCPTLRSFDLLGLNPAVPTAAGQLDYARLDGPRHYASVTNDVTAGANYRTVVDGVGVGALRDPHGNPQNAADCDVTTPAVARAADVLTWFTASGWGTPCAMLPVSDAGPLPDAGRPPAYRTRLTSIYPNPMNPGTRIAYESARPGDRVRLLVFDVTGRLVRTLVDAALPAGPAEARWDGRDDRGREVGAGMYFVRLAARDHLETRKLVVTR